AVRMRPSRVEELVAQGNSTAKLVQHIQGHLDEYLPVFQVGITLASIALGFVGQASADQIVHQVLGINTRAASTVAFIVEYGLISFLHVLLGELIPKQVAIRRTEGMALATSRPLQFFRIVFFLPITVLNVAARLLLKLFGMPLSAKESEHSED